MLLRILSFLLNRTFCPQAKASSGLWRKSLESSTIFCAIRAKIVSTKSQKWISLVYKQGRAYYPTAMPNVLRIRVARGVDSDYLTLKRAATQFCVELSRG